MTKEKMIWGFYVEDEYGNFEYFAEPDDDYLYVDIFGLGTVQIIRGDEGIVVNIFPLHVVDEPVATCHAHINDLISLEEEEHEPTT